MAWTRSVTNYIVNHLRDSDDAMVDAWWLLGRGAL